MDLEEIKKKISICTNEFVFFYYNFPKHFFFFFLNTKRLGLQKNHTNDVEVSKTYIRYDTLPRLKMVIE